MPACRGVDVDELVRRDATLSLRIGIAGAGLAAGLVIAAAGAWLDRFGRFGR